MRELGTAKALVEYCYDIVDRDGWCKFKLVEVADTMEEPYINIKRWWKVLSEANEHLKFFAEIRNRGVRGFEVRISDKWIDWRILNARKESTEPRSTKEVSPMSPLETDTDERSTKEVSKEVSPVSPLPMRNKVLIDQDQAIFAEPAFAGPPKRASKQEKTPDEQAYLDRKKAIEQAYVDELGYKPGAFAKEAKFAKELAELGYTPEQVVRCYRYLFNRDDGFYKKQHISLGAIRNQIGAFLKMNAPPKPSTNGTHSPPLVATKPNLPDKPVDRAALAAMVEASRRQRQ